MKSAKLIIRKPPMSTLEAVIAFTILSLLVVWFCIIFGATSHSISD